MITPEQLVKIARDVIGGNLRPTDDCSEAEIEGVRAGHDCPLAVRSPASHDVPEWVLEAMRRAYSAGYSDGQRGSAALHPRAE